MSINTVGGQDFDYASYNLGVLAYEDSDARIVYLLVVDLADHGCMVGLQADRCVVDVGIFEGVMAV